MDYQEALPRLERLRERIEYHRANIGDHAAYLELCELYGELEPIITRLEGEQQIQVPVSGGPGGTATYKNFIEAGILSSRTFYQHDALALVSKLIGKVRRLAGDPALPLAGALG